MADELKKTGIGYLPQQTTAQKDFPATVREVVLSGALSRRGRRFFYSGQEKEMAERAMERLGILDLKGRCFRELSGGAAAASAYCQGSVRSGKDADIG